MEAFLFILCGILILLIVLSKIRMQEYLLSAGAPGQGARSSVSYAALEMEYIRLTRLKSGRIGSWFWLELLSVISVFIVFGCFASFAG